MKIELTPKDINSINGLIKLNDMNIKSEVEFKLESGYTVKAIIVESNIILEIV